MSVSSDWAERAQRLGAGSEPVTGGVDAGNHVGSGVPGGCGVYGCILYGTSSLSGFVREFELSLPAVAATKRSGDERWH